MFALISRKAKPLAFHRSTVDPFILLLFIHMNLFARAFFFFKDYFFSSLSTTSKPPRQAKRSPDALEKNANETVEQRTGPLRFCVCGCIINSKEKLLCVF